MSHFRTIGMAAVAALALTLPAQVQAQGLFEALFGGFARRQAAPPSLPPQASSFADPLGLFGGGGGGESRRPSYSEGGGSSVSYCVRTCDGRFFPMQRHAGATPAEMCKSFCPTAQTLVLSGSKIDSAAASNGTRYADLDNAYVYRERVVDNCTCNGKDAFGLAKLDVAADPTLRPGDIVATTSGMMAYRGGGRSKTAEFSPINPSSSAWAKQLAATKVVPQPAPEKITPVAEETTSSIRRGRRAAQASR